MALLEISNLTVEFQVRHGFFRAVDGVSLRIDPGEIVSIVGESGSTSRVSHSETGARSSARTWR
jgi:dipeptide transport system ATP-binding protein